MDPSPPQHNILMREWLAIALVGGIITSLAITSWLPQLEIEKAASHFHNTCLSRPLIEIQIEGAVNHPGVYSFPPGVTVKEVLKKVSLLKQADRKAIAFRKVFITSQTLVVPYKKAETRPMKRKRVCAKRASCSGNLPE